MFAIKNGLFYTTKVNSGTGTQLFGLVGVSYQELCNHDFIGDMKIGFEGTHEEFITHVNSLTPFKVIKVDNYEACLDVEKFRAYNITKVEMRADREDLYTIHLEDHSDNPGDTIESTTIYNQGLILPEKLKQLNNIGMIKYANKITAAKDTLNVKYETLSYVFKSISITQVIENKEE